MVLRILDHEYATNDRPAIFVIVIFVFGKLLEVGLWAQILEVAVADDLALDVIRHIEVDAQDVRLDRNVGVKNILFASSFQIAILAFRSVVYLN